MAGRQELLPIHGVDLDRSNPRIRRFLEIYEGEITDERIALALDIAGDAGTEGGKGATTPERLRNSIIANRGIIQPIIVNRGADGRLTCIEGNTRLYLYRQFDRDTVEGDWSQIPAMVHDVLDADGIDAIRLQAHLVGPRAWDAYSKAKYQWELYNRHMMPLDRLVDLCGGDRRDVQKSINAYSDMEEHYRKLHGPEDFYDTQKYSGFVELQNNKVKTAIFSAGFTLDDFASWIKSGKIAGLASVRQLPRVLNDSKARSVFIKKGLKAALDAIEQPDIGNDLRAASMGQLSRALLEKVEGLPFSELQRLRNNPDDDVVRHLADTYEALRNLIAELGQLEDVG